jgi:hypothetical protein
MKRQPADVVVPASGQPTTTDATVNLPGSAHPPIPEGGALGGGGGGLAGGAGMPEPELAICWMIQS